MINILKSNLFFIFLLFLIFPLLILLYNSFDYIFNNKIIINEIISHASGSFVIAFYTIIFSSIFAVIPAWFLSIYKISYSKYLKFMVLMPIIFPTYILAFFYSELFNDSFIIFLRDNFGLIFDFKTRIGAIFCFSLVFYPYLYLIMLVWIKKTRETIVVFSIYKKINIKNFFKYIFPSLLPAYFAGCLIILIEVFAELGVVNYFNLKTFSTLIMKYWLIKGDFAYSTFISLILVLITIVIYFIYSLLVKNKSYYEAIDQFHNEKLIINPIFNKLIILFCCLIFLFAFAIPFIFTIFWVIKDFNFFISFNIIKILSNTIIIAGLASLIIISISLIVNILNNRKNSFSDKISKIMTLGYCIPGAVIGIAIVLFFQFLSNIFNINMLTLLNFSIIGLLYGYVIRFYSIGYHNINIAYQKIRSEIHDVANIYVKTSYERLKQIYLPILTKPIFIVFILTSLEITKELPLTFLIRPFNFDTLATKSYMLAMDELLVKSVISGFWIVLLNFIILFKLYKKLQNDKV